MPRRNLKNVLHRLSRLCRTDLPFVSAYVDLTPERDAPSGDASRVRRLPATLPCVRPERPRRCPGPLRLRAMLAMKGLAFRGVEHDSFEADAMRLRLFLDAECPAEAPAVAVFACAGEDRWEVAELPTPVATQLVVGQTPFLTPLRDSLEAQQDRAELETALNLNGVGLGGLTAVLAALREGCVEVLFLDSAFRSDGLGQELSHWARLAGAGVRYIECCDGLRRVGGVAALLHAGHNASGNCAQRVPRDAEPPSLPPFRGILRFSAGDADGGSDESGYVSPSRGPLSPFHSDH